MTSMKRQQQDGFTLAELAIVLVIIALLTGGIMGSIGAQRNLSEIRQTQALLAEAQEALIGFAVANGRLPRPAISSTDGLEQASCSDDFACSGFLPWQTLGIRSEDAWEKRLRYSVTPAFANSQFTLLTSGSKKIRSRDDAGNLIYLFGQAAACNATNNPCAPAVIYSHGRLHWGVNSSGNSMGGGTATSVDEDVNNVSLSGTGTDFFARTETENTSVPGGEFDDIVLWISPYLLFNRMVAAGRLP